MLDYDLTFFSFTVEAPVRRFSRPAPTFEVHEAGDLAPSSSLDGLKIGEDMPWMMDQSAPPSPISSRSGSPVPPFEEVISGVRAQRTAAVAQKDQVAVSTREVGIVSAGQPGKLETSMSLGRIADFLGDICGFPFTLAFVHF